MKVELFIPCFVDQLFPQTAFNMIRILEWAGCEVSYNEEQVCCGQPAYNAGFQEQCRSVAKKFIGDFSGDHFVIAPSGSCTGFVRNYYADIFLQTEDTEEVGLKTPLFFEFTEFLVDELKVVDFGSEFYGKAVYHDACGALRECGIKDAPRKLLSCVRGLELIESEDCERCCGFGGTFSVKYEPISVAMGEQKIQNAMKLGAEYLISTDLSCLMHLDGYIRQNHLPLKTIHVADVLASGRKYSKKT